MSTRVGFLAALFVSGYSMDAASVPEQTAQSQQTVTSACWTNTGVNPAKASLAVAIAKELKRWDVLSDLAVVGDRVALSETGQARCKANGGCPEVTTILRMQDSAINQVVDRNAFNATAFREDLGAAWQRQADMDADIGRNSPGFMPEDHVLTPTDPFTPSPVAPCGVYKFFLATTPSGAPLAEPGNLRYRLEFFGGDSNPYLAFAFDIKSAKVAVDPDEFGNTYPGSCAGGSTLYPDDWVYNTTWYDNYTYWGDCFYLCVTTDGWSGSLWPSAYWYGWLCCLPYFATWGC
jgi:hypothetical protein